MSHAPKLPLRPGAPGNPLPRPSALTRPYWDGCREGVLRFQRCRACDAAVFVPQPVCGACLGDELEWVESCGTGAVYSFSVVHRPPQPAFDTPYVVAIVELDEGWHLLTNLIGVEPSEVRIGMRVEVSFQALSDEIALPYFRPSPSPSD